MKQIRKKKLKKAKTAAIKVIKLLRLEAVIIAWQNNWLRLAKIYTIYMILLLSFWLAKNVQAANVNFTVSAWVRAAGTATSSAIVVKDNEIRLVTDAAGRPACQIHNGTAWQTAVAAKTALAANKWQFVACAYDGANLKIYLDGAESGSRAETNDVQNTANPWRIGADAGGAYSNWLGYIDEVKIYPYARTATEIRQDYAAGVAGVKTRHGTAVAFGSASDSWLTDGLVGYWKFDESATTSGAIDSSGNGNTGTYYGNASTTAGKFGNGGSFDGDGDYIIFNFQFSIFKQFSISQFINFQTLATGKPIISQWGNSQNAVLIKSDDTNADEIKVCIASGLTDNCANYGATTDANISAGTWYHLQVIYNGAQANNAEKLKIFINGEQKTLSFSGTIPASFPNSSENLELGGDSDLAEYTDIKIDEVRIYNRALSPEEVRKLYEWAPGPVAWWKFDEGAGDTAYDAVASSSTAGGNNGTITGATWTRGKYGKALSFDGTDDEVSVNTKSSLNNLAPLTITAWIRPNSGGGGNRGEIVGKTMPGEWGWHLAMLYDSIEFSVHYSTSSLSARTDYGSIDFGKWYYLTVVWNGGSSHNDVDFYLNGTSYGPAGNENDGAGNRVDDSNIAIRIGRNKYESERVFDGLIDDVRIYNYALTQKQILEVMAGRDPSRPGRAIKYPVLHLKFDKGHGGTAYDSNPICVDLGSNCNNGTLYPGTGGANTATSAMWSLDGKFGKGVELDGVDDYISIPDFSY